MWRKYWQAPAILALLTIWLVTVSASNAVSSADRMQSTLDPLAVTASAIVQGATDTAAAQQATSAAPGFEPLAATATTMVQRATLGPHPTLSSEIVGFIQQQFVDILKSSLGFYHPVFEEAAGSAAASRFFQLGMPYKPQVVTTDFESNKYVAAILPASLPYNGPYRFDPDYPADGLFVFRIPDGTGTPILVDKIAGSGPASEFFNLYPDGLDTGFLTNAHRRDAYPEPPVYGFQDVNKNGLPDLAITGYPGGNTPWLLLMLYEITGDHQVVNITPHVPARWDGFYMDGFADPNGDGVWEIRMADVANAAANLFHPQMYDTRWFGWNGSAYVDITSQMADFYQPDIDAFMSQLQNAGPCFRPTDEMSWALAHYFELGRLREAWAEIEPRLRWNECTPEQMADFDYGIPLIQQWVEYYSDRQPGQ
jgi:hypothetical protein